MERPRRCKSKEELYSKVLRVKRKDILAELPDTAVILNDPRLEKIFTQFEKIESTSQKSSSDNADKLIQVVESKGYDAYKIFISVLKEYRPSLADKLTAALAAEELSRMNSGEDISRPCNNHGAGIEEEDAGIFHFNDRGSGPSDHISSLSVTSRNYLSEHIRDKETFRLFCQAMEVNNHLVQVCLRSGNPTGYLMQELTSDHTATMDRLQTALDHIQKPELYQSVLKLNGGL